MQYLFRVIQENFRDFTAFNYAERRGIAALLVLILLAEAARALLPDQIRPESPAIAEFKKDLGRFEAWMARPDTLREQQKHSGKKTRQYPNFRNKPQTTAAKPRMIIEVNTADSAQLVRIYGIGPVFAKRILKYRGLLGGFYSKEQLQEVYGMDSARYTQMEEQIRVDTTKFKRIAVNDASFKTLLRHPYLDYETVKQIVNYRQAKGRITGPDTLKAVIAYDPLFIKVMPYFVYASDTLTSPQESPKPE